MTSSLTTATESTENTMPQGVLAQLAVLAGAGRIRQLDYQFSRFIAARDDRPEVVLAAALVSYQLGQGNVCLELSSLASHTVFELADWEALSLTRGLALHRLEQYLTDSVVVGAGKPLMFSRGRLYLSRYWRYEQQVAVSLTNAAADSWLPPLTDSLERLFRRDYELVFKGLEKARQQSLSLNQPLNHVAFAEKFLDVVNPDLVDWTAVESVLQQAANSDDLLSLESLVPAAACLNWQKVSAAVAAGRRFSVISGGPGTGKTTTVTKLLALLVEQHLHQYLSQQSNLESGLQASATPLIIKLVAPTGKAAARLTESIGGAKQQLNLDPQVAELIPEQAGTIHRLLGVIPNREAFRHNADNPLHLDLLVVDEASMVDLPLMAKLLNALPPKARLILLGDKDQLSSVEAGSVLGDICSFADSGYSQSQSQWLSAITGYQLDEYSQSVTVPAVADSLCILRKSFRFDASSGIGMLAKAINSGDARAVDNVWQQDFSDINLHGVGERVYNELLLMAVDGYRPYLQQLAVVNQAEQARPIIELFNQFQILVALREGDFGISGINQRIERVLSQQGLIRKGGSEWYAGRPVMITQNDHGLGLYNGDIGITLISDEAVLSIEGDNQGTSDHSPARPRVYFLMADGQIRSFLPSRLPAHETVYAMTIHKSQGSEFAHTVMVLPKQDSPLLTRELVYTGVTRAKSRLDVFSHPGILSRAVKRRTERASGLADLLAQSSFFSDQAQQ